MGHHGITRGAAADRYLVASHDWQAQMIAPLSDGGQGSQSSFVAKTFTLAQVSPGTVLHLSAQGLYRAFLNGTRVGNDLLTPGWTCYDDRIAYQSYDVTGLLRAGENRLEIWLGDGWYRSQMMWKDKPIFNCWGDRIAALAQMECGDDTLLVTDASWRSGLLPITCSGIYYGEDYDARIIPHESHGCEALAFDHGLLIPHEAPAVRELAAIAPVDRWKDAQSRDLIDFGQNCAAYLRITVQGEAGAKVRLDHAEVLGPNRAFDNRNYRSARGAEEYTLAGTGGETYAPMFTFHGFRYARITITGRAQIKSVEMIPVTSITEQRGGFTCGVAEVNRLVLNTLWSQRSNFIEIPTDCPQRDERLGWTGDAQVFAGTACWLGDVDRFLRKYLRDVIHDQRANGAIPHFSPDPTRLHPAQYPGDWAGSTGWGDAITVIPWQLYLHYGDTSVLRECFAPMKRWVDYLWNLSDGPIIHPNAVWGGPGFTFGDWLQPVGDNRKPRPTIADDCAATLYHFISTDLAARIAEILGEDASDLVRRSNEIRHALAQEYFSPTGRLAHNDQTSYALAFLHDLVPEHYHAAAKAYFRRVMEDADGLIGTGFIGTPALLPALTKLGMLDVAEKVLLNPKVPGWLYQVKQGATSIWERWDAIAPDGTIYDPDMNSYNHYSYGAVCQWMFEAVAGIAPMAQAPGFARVRIAPQILPALSPVAAWHDTAKGRITAEWALTGDNVTYRISLPPECEGLLMPNPTHHGLLLNGSPCDLGDQGMILPPGNHEITFTIKT